jgi:hypothetical protein
VRRGSFRAGYAARGSTSRGPEQTRSSERGEDNRPLAYVGFPAGCSCTSSVGGTRLTSRSPVRPRPSRPYGERHSGCDGARRVTRHIEFSRGSCHPTRISNFRAARQRPQGEQTCAGCEGATTASAWLPNATHQPISTPVTRPVITRPNDGEPESLLAPWHDGSGDVSPHPAKLSSQLATASRRMTSPVSSPRGLAPRPFSVTSSGAFSAGGTGGTHGRHSGPRSARCRQRKARRGVYIVSAGDFPLAIYLSTATCVPTDIEEN